MTILEFNTILTRSEAGRVEISVAQMAEAVRRINDATGGELYPLIRNKTASEIRANLGGHGSKKRKA